MTLDDFNAICARRVDPPVSSIQAAKTAISARTGKPITARLVDMPKDLQRAVVLLARQYRKGPK